MVDVAEIPTTTGEVRAIVETPPPTCKQSLQAFRGLPALSDRFLKQRDTVAMDLYHLLRKAVTYAWGGEAPPGVSEP